MTETKPPVVLSLTWNERLTFTAREGGHEWALDGRNQAGPSPVVALASALAGCMSMDVVHILTKGRFDIRSLSVTLTGRRTESEPRRFVAFDLRFTIDTDAPANQIDRAIALSREKYCSVWHSLRQDVELATAYDIVRAG